MIVKLNGQYLMTVGEEKPYSNDGETIVIGKGVNSKLKKMAITFWTLSASFMMKSSALAADVSSSSLWVQMKPLMYFFQDMAMVFGVLAIIAGLILLVVKKRWGVTTLKVSAFVVLGVFLVPSAVLLLAILGMFLDDSLTSVLNGIREARDSVPVDGGK
jgi:hypothetical protein